MAHIGSLHLEKPLEKLPLRDIKTPERGTLTGIEMVNKISKIPDKVLKEIFPKSSMGVRLLKNYMLT